MTQTSKKQKQTKKYTPKETRKEYAGTALFQEFYKTHDLSLLLEGHREFMAANHEGFVGRLRGSSGAHYLGNEFPGVEYELKFNVIAEPNMRVRLSPIGLATAAQRTFNGMKKYLADGLTNSKYNDVHYFGAEDEMLLIEEGHPVRLKQKSPLPYLVSMPQTAIVTKRSEHEITSGKLEDTLRSTMFAAEMGAKYVGPAVKGKADVSVLDSRNGRVYTITASESTANQHRLYQLEVEYKGFIGAFPGERNTLGKRESEEEIVQGIYDMGMHIRRRIAWDKPSFVLEPTTLTKYHFVKQVQGDRSDKVQAAHVEQLRKDGIVKLHPYLM